MSLLSNLTSARRCTFTLTSFHTRRVQILVCCHSDINVYRDEIRFSDLLSGVVFLVNILFAWKDCLLHLVERTARLPVLLLVNTTAESLFELARGSGLLYVLVVDLKLCNQE